MHQSVGPKHWQALICAQHWLDGVRGNSKGLALQIQNDLVTCPPGSVGVTLLGRRVGPKLHQHHSLKNYCSPRSGNWVRDYYIPFTMPDSGLCSLALKSLSTVQTRPSSHWLPIYWLLEGPWSLSTTGSNDHSSPTVGFINHSHLVSRG